MITDCYGNAVCWATSGRTDFMGCTVIRHIVYNRLWHTQQTVEVMRKNELARASELLIYSDEAKEYR